MTLIQANNLTKTYPVRRGILRRQAGSLKALQRANFSINEGEVLGVVGESGSGKSTLGRALLRLEEPTAGTIEMEGEAILSLAPPQLRRWRKKAQMVFQDPYASLNPRKTIGENVGGALKFHQLVKSEAEAGEWAIDALEQVGLSPDVARRHPHEFSGGQQQRICIARALALRPKLLVCDEVVSALDVSVQAQILNLLQDLKERFGMSYLFISHDLAVIRYLCDRVLVLYQGEVCEQGLVDTIFEDAKHPYTRKLLASIPRDYPMAGRGE